MVAPEQNKSLIYKAVPDTFPEAGTHLTIEERPIDIDTAELHGGILVKVLYTSLDPYLRILMRDPKIKSYSPPLNLDEPIQSAIVGKVVRSNTPQYQIGDTIATFYGENAEYTIIPESSFSATGLRKVENTQGLPLSYYVGYLGMPGATSVQGFYEVGQPKKGETIFISAAAGAVGQVVGQLAKAEGLTVIGSAGSQEKVDFIKSLGFDVAFNYKEEKPLDALRRLVPQGIDIYWDNVGGEALEAALEMMNDQGRIVACGSISGYNSKPEDRYGVRNTFYLVTKRLRIQGFIVDLSPPKYNAAIDKLAPLFAEGKIQVKEDVYDGIERGPESLIGIFKGQTFGKTILKVADV
ncbi:zinc-binding dehydrogenase [Colletotrichum truncatum]|uniref:Zinc-binding dehydrogenase n=1 Tax=Colletotrichum truncatum TaxID=5467 RepID=A0ACC3YP18_COLTU|nr:zinc-binding dehydrogenase [Colletotrichum truncatum]KAF6781153.1 zinc-binding dehydrogenase [Colletotrichum truncatum]